MDPRPVKGLPHYNLTTRCQRCSAVAAHRVEVEHPDRGLLLVCGVCAHLLGSMRDPFA